MGQVRINMNNGILQSRTDVFVLFSKVLKISNIVMRLENIKNLWLNLLEQGSFFLHISDSNKRKYTFVTIIELIISGDKTFIVDIIEIDPHQINLTNIAESVDSICFESVGDSRV